MTKRLVRGDNQAAACVVSLIDRLVHHSEVIAIEGESYRMKEAREQAAKRRSRKKVKPQ